MRYLIAALIFLSICLALPPLPSGAVGVLRVTTVATEVTQGGATPQPVAAPAYPAPAYPAPAKRKGERKAPVVEPGLHCGHCP